MWKRNKKCGAKLDDFFLLKRKNRSERKNVKQNYAKKPLWKLSQNCNVKRSDLFFWSKKVFFRFASKRKQLEAKRTIWCELSKKKQKNESVSFACSSRSKNLFFAKPAHPNFYYTSKTEHRNCDYHSLCFGLQPCRNRTLPRDYITERPPPEYPSLFAGKHFEVYQN